MCDLKKQIFLLLWTMITIDGQRWYTATVIQNNLSENKDNSRENEKVYEPVSTVPHKEWDDEKKSELNQILQQKENHESKKRIPFNTAVAPRPFKIEVEKAPPKFEALKRNEMFLEDMSPKNNSLQKKLQTVVWFNRTVNHVNLVRRPKPRRKIVKQCPSLRPRRQKKQLGEKSSRFLDIFHVVEFQNVPCTSSSGLDGICLHQYECKSTGGLPMGDCADGYGTCCVLQLSCGAQTNAQASWFTNPGFPSPSTERLSCSLTVDKASDEIQQIRLDFLNFELLPPTEGSCEQDQFVVTGQNVNNVVPILCGVNNGQHIYIEVGDIAGPLSLTVQSVVEETRLFAIKITQLTAFDDAAAPPNCLQYFKERTGILESFNYQDKSTLVLPKSPSYLNNLNYAMCINRVADSCSITYTNTGDMEIYNYDIDGLPLIPPGQAGVEIFNCPSDWLLMAAARLCGDRLNDGTVFQDFSLDAPVTDTTAGPIVVWFRSDGSYAGRGFRLQYEQNSCSPT